MSPMRILILSLALFASLLVTGCDKDRNKGKGGHKPPPTEKPAEKVPDAPSTLQLSAVAAAAFAAYYVSTRKERERDRDC